ncbi:MAG: hypothetical protein IKX24_09380 [Prevotella sp.]|jgi:hypothetical protein|nr:hypothetical protein [Prevotella sp.]MBR5062334.1 hypothetical protein [Prevotella sp.]
MKKTYISPILTIVSSKTEEDLLQASGVFGPDQGIDYGGVDDDGSMDPAGKEFNFSVWDE